MTVLNVKNALNTALTLWNLRTPALLIETGAHWVYKVIDGDQPATLKMSKSKSTDEISSEARVLRIWNEAESVDANGRGATDAKGAVRVRKVHEGFLLLDFIDGPSLAQYFQAKESQSREESLWCGSRVSKLVECVCEVLDVIHLPAQDVAHSRQALNDSAFMDVDSVWDIPSLARHFQSLFKLATTKGVDPIYLSAAATARELLTHPLNTHILHGDIHPENILISTGGVGLVIDPKGVIGERTYDVSNIFYNLDLIFPWSSLNFSERSEILAKLAEKFAERLGVSARRVLRFAFAHGGLSAAWMLEDGQDPLVRLGIARQIESLFKTL